MDVTQRHDWDRALDVAKAVYGGIDILVNNAGWTYRRQDTLKVTEVDYDSEPDAAASID